MKAVRVNEWGQPLQIEELSQPTPAADEVLVRVRAASVNPIDRAVAAGYMRMVFSTPLTLGVDFAGEVVAVGDEVTHVKPGDDVYGANIRQGAFAEYVVVKASGLALKPKSLDDEHAAAVPLAGLSAWQALFDEADLQRGERVLIHGAGGGIGAFAVQLAKNHGAYVIGHDRSVKAAFVRQLGADEFISAEDRPFEELVDSVDVVLDLVGADVAQRSFSVLRSGGRCVTTAAQLDPDAGRDLGIIVKNQFTQPTTEKLSRLAAEIDAGRLKVYVNRTFRFDEAPMALYYKPENGASGKTVISLN